MDRRCRHPAEAGFTIIEVLVAAVLVVLVTSGVLAGLDFTSRASGNARARSVAYTLAQREQARLRGRPAASLIGTQSRSAQVDNADYTITATGRAMADADGNVGCTGGGAGFVALTTEVSYPNQGSRQPVRLHTMVARPFTDPGSTTGSAVLILKNAAGNPLASIPTTLTGPTGATPTTDAQGCAFASGLTPGSYTFTVNQGGYVGPDGGALSVATSVAAQQIATKTASYDRPGSVTVNAYTRKSGAGADIASTPGKITLGQTGLTGGSKIVTMASVSQSIGSLFPFSDGYKINTGDCTANALGTPPAGRANSFTVAPNGSATVNIFQPALDITMVVPAAYASYYNPANTRAVFTPKDSGCSTRVIRQFNASKTLDDPGVPYGDYDICIEASAVISGSLVYSTVTRTAVANTNNAGTALTMTLPSSPTPPCP